MRMLKMSHGDRPGTLVDFIAMQMEKKYPGELADVFAESGEADQIRAAARRKLADIDQELTKMRTRGAQMLKALQVANSGEGTETEDAVMVQHREVLAMCNTELDALQVRLHQLKGTYDQLCKWFHMEGREKKATDEFFGIWSSFLQDVDTARKAIQEREKQEALKQRRAERSRSAGALHKLMGDDEDGEDTSPRRPARSGGRAHLRQATREMLRGDAGRATCPKQVEGGEAAQAPALSASGSE